MRASRKRARIIGRGARGFGYPRARRGHDLPEVLTFGIRPGWRRADLAVGYSPGPVRRQAGVEREARNMFDQARQIALNKNPTLAVTMLEGSSPRTPNRRLRRMPGRRSSDGIELGPVSEHRRRGGQRRGTLGAAESPTEAESVIVEATAPVGADRSRQRGRLACPPTRPSRAGPTWRMSRRTSRLLRRAPCRVGPAGGPRPASTTRAGRW